MKLKLIGAALALSSSITANAAGIIYNQAEDGTGNRYASTYDTGNNNPSLPVYTQIWNAFELDPSVYASASISGASWIGSHDASLDLGPTGLAADFYVEISDAEDPLFPIIGSIEGTATETSLGGGLFSYAIDFAAPFALDIGHTYYMSVLAEYALPAWNDADSLSKALWYWNTSNAGFSTGYSNLLAPPDDEFTLRSNMAFALTGDATFQPTTVPEPSTIWLLGLAMIGLARFSTAKATESK